MKFKGLKILITLLTVFMFAATAFAGGEAEIKTDVPAIPQSVCDQAGWISMEVGDTFSMIENDSIEWSMTNGVVLCKPINIFLIVGDALVNTTYVEDNTEAISVSDNGNNTVTFTSTAAAALDLAEIAAGNGALGLHVVGNLGQQTVTVTLRRIDLSGTATHGTLGSFAALAGADTQEITMTYAVGALGDPSDTMIIRLFDNKDDIYTGAVLPAVNAIGPIGFYQDSDSDSLYDEFILPEDNSLCIDTLTNSPQFESGQYVNVTPDSQPAALGTQISFTGDSRVANITGSEGYTIDRISKAPCSDLAIGGTLDQFGTLTGAPTSFDPGAFDNTAQIAATGSRWSAGTPMCDTAGTGVLITKTTDLSITDSYQIEISLAVMASGSSTYATADPAEVWFNTAATVFDTDSGDSNIQHDNTLIPTTGGAATAIVDATTTNTTGYTWGYFNAPDATHDSFLLDVGQIGIDPDALTVGDTIGLVVTLRKFPCGEVITETLCMGVLVETCSTSGSSTLTNLYFPFGIGANNDGFWSGVTLSNKGTAAGAATCTLYGDQGGMGVYEIANVDGLDMVLFSVNAGFMSALEAGATLTGDESFQMNCACQFDADGVMMIGGDAFTMLHGYLAR